MTRLGSRLSAATVGQALVVLGCFWLGCTGQGCSGSTRNAQMVVADGIAQAANAAAPSVVSLYKSDLTACLDDAGTRIEFNVCSTAVEFKWSRTRLAWDHLRRVQDLYAQALEKGDSARTLEYLDTLRAAYCEVSTVAPPELAAKLSKVNGLVCTGNSDGGSQ